MSIIILILLFVVLMAPLVMQSRKQKAQYAKIKDMQDNLKVGDRVRTAAGLEATIVALSEETMDLEIAPGVVTTWVRIAAIENLSAPSAAEPVVENDR